MNKQEGIFSEIARKFPYLPVVIVILTGTILTLVSWAVTRDLVWEKRIHVDFEKKAEDRYEILRGAIESNLQVIESLRAFYISSQKVDRWAFQSFAGHLLSYHEDLQALAWVERVFKSQRELYEAAVRQEGFPEFQITERLEQGKMTRAGEREVYFPVHFVEPYNSNDMAFGFDEASNQTRREAMERSCDTGETTVTPKLKLVQDRVVQFGLLVFSPIYRKGSPADSVQTRRENLEGFILVVFRIRDLVEKALGTLNPEGINMAVYDPSAPEERRFVYHYVEQIKNPATPTVSSEKPNEETGLDYTMPLRFAGREWLIACRATSSFLSARRTWSHWVVLSIGLLLTVLLACYMLFGIYRRQYIEGLVKERTAEIEKSNMELKLAQEQVLVSLREKETLLREIYHRVKNNLQVISTLLTLQLDFIRDASAIRIFQETRNRIEAMALIHDKLYQSKDLAGIDVSDYIHDLVVNLFLLHGVDSARITYGLDIADVSFDIDTAIPFGMVVNELVSNCLRHAFPEGQGNGKPEGMIRIDLDPADRGKFVLSVSDNGVGFPRELDYRNTESLGLKLVMGLVGQLEGAIELDSSQGTRFTVMFSELKYKARG